MGGLAASQGITKNHSQSLPVAQRLHRHPVAELVTVLAARLLILLASCQCFWESSGGMVQAPIGDQGGIPRSAIVAVWEGEPVDRRSLLLCLYGSLSLSFCL